MDSKQAPSADWIAGVRRRFPTERTIDEALTRKLRNRAGPPYAPSALGDIAARLRAFLADHDPGSKVSDVAPLGGGASKEQFRFALQRLQQRKMAVEVIGPVPGAPAPPLRPKRAGQSRPDRPV